jgi:hypothetical protein
MNRFAAKPGEMGVAIYGDTKDGGAVAIEFEKIGSELTVKARGLPDMRFSAYYAGWLGEYLSEEFRPSMHRRFQLWIGRNRLRTHRIFGW